MSWVVAGTMAKKALAGLVTFVIPVPLIAILAALAWVHFDRSSAVRRAVDKAVTELVAGAKIAALESEIDGRRRLAMYAAANAEEARRRAETAEAAAIELETQLALSEEQREEFERELEEREDDPLPDGCRVDQRLLDRLRNR